MSRAGTQQGLAGGGGAIQQQLMMRTAPGTASMSNSERHQETAPRGLIYAAAATENGLCQRIERRCSRPKIDGQKLCAKHLKQCPEGFRRCSYISSRSALKCTNVFHKNDSGKEGFCVEHARMVSCMRRQAAYKQRHKDTADSILHSLKHYRSFSSDQNIVPRDVQSTQTQSSDGKKPPPVNKTKNSIDYLSESSDEDEPLVSVDDCPQFEDDEICDTVVDDSNDPLRNASIFTAQEIATIARDRLVRQQTLYFEYMELLKEKYRIRSALYRKRIEEETKIGPFTASDYHEHKRLGQLKAMRRYHKKKGMNAVLKQRRRLGQMAGHLYYGDGRKCAQKLDEATGSEQPPVICSQPPLPESSFCFAHILSDEKQCLFKKCAKMSCQKPIVALLPDDFCWLHKEVPSKIDNITPLPEMAPSPVDITPPEAFNLPSMLDTVDVIDSDSLFSSSGALDNFSKIVDQVVSGQLKPPS
uniref:KAT8 regulatory NSL complex subunit 2 n=1 Tax=Plectus sambesii TaxID=2011161 RepID=A0A914UR99_9BILA